MDALPAPYLTLVERLRELGVLRSAAALLGWDEQVNLPPKGGQQRANQMGLLAGMAHDRATDPALGELLDQLSDENALGGAASVAAANVREARRNYDRSTRLPKRLVEELSRVTTLSQQAWVDARKRKSFGAFEPWLRQVVSLKQEEADALGSSSGVRYDALLDDYEPGATRDQLQQVFAPLRKELVQLVGAIRESGVQPDIALLTRSYPVEMQRVLGMEAAAAIGFDFAAGRLDVTAHPFCSGIAPGDCRLTTRYDEFHFSGSLFGTLHEAGHGLYEQGLNEEQYGLPCGEACSLGIHESQSRMWENLVGRSRAFWEYFYPRAQSLFPASLGDVPLDSFHAAINDVRPSWIRVEADEVTYNLHIMLRFELEQALIGGDLLSTDVPAAWNEKFLAYFDMTPPDDALGCLQDVHWSAGLLGYFPTYSLGNMVASQLFEQAAVDLGDLGTMFRRGEFHPLLEWLRTRIHIHGKRYSPGSLVEQVTGQPLSSAALLRHLRGRFGEVYRLG